MPVILPKEAYGPWLDFALLELGQVQSLLHLYQAEEMTAYSVGTWVNSPGNNDARCLETVA